jgi:fluoride ion exporter CrcB/FEX
LWAIELFAGGEFLWTSYLTHLALPAIGIAGVRRLGAPPGLAWRALLGVGLIQALCRICTPPVENVNMVFSQQPEWRAVFPSYFVNYLAGLALHAAGFLLLEHGLRRWAQRPGRTE